MTAPPVFNRPPPRTQDDFDVEDCYLRMATSESLDTRMLWARRLVAALRRRGDLPPESTELVACHHESYAREAGADGQAKCGGCGAVLT